MKPQFLLAVCIYILCPDLAAQKIGLLTTSPLHPIHMVQPTGTTLASQEPVMFTEYTGVNTADVIAIRGKSKPLDFYGIGGDFEGGWIGVQGRIAGGLNQSYIGVRGDVAGTGTGNFYGTYGYAHSTGNNYGVYGTATGGLKNYAGYFASGDVFIQNELSIANTNPQHPVHINQPVGMTISENFPVMHVEYTGSNAANVIAIRGRCVLPTSHGIGGQFEGGAIGVQGKVTTTLAGVHYGVQGVVSSQNGTNVAIYGDATGVSAINYAGYFGNGMVYIDDDLGVGMDPVTNRLEVNGNASKSVAGSWLANSDERLKKNIQQLSAEEMIEKLLALKGVTYEWNDDKTGIDRPEGIQYGFTAQNIQKVFPSLVEEDAQGFLQTAYGTYDAMMVEALRYLYLENQMLRKEIAEIKSMLSGGAAGK